MGLNNIGGTIQFRTSPALIPLISCCTRVSTQKPYWKGPATKLLYDPPSLPNEPP